MKVFYHTDMDGKASAAIVRKYYKLDQDYQDKNPNLEGAVYPFEMFPINYNIDFPFGKIESQETVVIVDFSLQKDGEFEELLKITDNVIWIDHHISAIQKHNHLQYKLDGIRKVGVAGCVLTWQYFYPDKLPSMTINLIGDYDIWEFQYGEITNYLQSGIRIFDTSPQSSNWLKWLDGKYYPDQEIATGEVVEKYKENNYKSLIKGLSFYCVFEGYRAVCCNQAQTGSPLFNSVDESTYDIMITFSFNGLLWSVHIYTKKEDIDVSEIAVKYGGGGHRNAAGFQCTTLPFSFKNLKTNSSSYD